MRRPDGKQAIHAAFLLQQLPGLVAPRQKTKRRFQKGDKMNIKIKPHRFAELFPMMTAEELDALADDIKEHGLINRIVRYQGMVLDGRNRLAACQKADVDPQFVDHEGDDASALGLLISLNVQRRDLTAAQRAIAAAKVWGLQSATKSVHDIAKQLRVDDKYIRLARDLLAEAPDLATQVDGCQLSLAAAHEQLKARRAEVIQREKDMERVQEFRDQIEAGEMTVEEALCAVFAKEREEKEKEAAWFNGIAEFLTWIEKHAVSEGDQDIARLSEKFSDHAITPKRIKSAIAQLERVLTHGFRGCTKKRSAEGLR
jgi:ParB-like chromosome segregation protein Spo0J